MRFKILITGLLLFLLQQSVVAQEVQQKVPDKTRILFLLDASGSMLATWKNEHRIDAAKRILGNLVDSLRSDENLELALRVYGHLYFRESQNCKDSRLEVPFRSDNHDLIISKLQDIKPKGTTPIAYSLEQAGNDFPSANGYRNIVVLITDGIESCDGDPCAVSVALQRKGIYLKPFIIGIGMNADYSQHFGCIGKYYDAVDEIAFRRALNDAIETTLATTTATVELQNNTGKSAYTNINVTFENDFTGTSAFDFIHYLDSRGRPDTVEIDPVLTYNVVVNTLPRIVKRDIRIRPGSNNHIAVKTPQGNLKVSQAGAGAYKDKVQVLMHTTRGNLFHIQEMNSSQQYVEGSYQVIVTTLPQRSYNVEIKEGESRSITVPDPGIVNFDNSFEGYGSIYEISTNGKQEWVGQITPTNNRTSWTLQPGDYKVVFRSRNAKGSKYTSIKYFTIRSGASSSLKLF